MQVKISRRKGHTGSWPGKFQEHLLEVWTVLTPPSDDMTCDSNTQGTANQGRPPNLGIESLYWGPVQSHRAGWSPT